MKRNEQHRRKLAWLALVPALAITGCHVSIADDCAFSADRSARLDTAGLRRIVVSARAGDLKVTGKQGAEALEASGRACTTHRERLDGIQLITERKGDVGYLTVEIPDMSGVFINVSAHLDLDVTLPADLPVEVHDTSGEASLQTLAELRVEDGSGDLSIADVSGNVWVDDNSGETTLRGVTGSVEVIDGSGDLHIKGVGRDVKVTDGSGSVWVEDIDGSVRVAEDGSGDLTLRGVGGAVVIESDGSGSIEARDVAGDFTVETDGSGGVDITGVKGEVKLPERHRR